MSVQLVADEVKAWVPAFAGMTVRFEPLSW